MTQLVEFEGKTHEFPDEFSQEDVGNALSTYSQPETKLFSLEGVHKTLKSVGPSLVRGVMGAQLKDMEELHSARQARITNKEILTPEELTQHEKTGTDIKLLQESIGQIDDDLETLGKGMTRPLRWFNMAVQSTAQGAPGLASALATRNMGSVAMVPALQQAQSMQEGQAYAESRGGHKPKTQDIPAAQQDANIQGVAEAGFEMMPLGYVVDKMGKVGFAKFLAGFYGRELMSELPTTAVQDISQYMLIDKDKPLGQFMHDLGNDLVDTVGAVGMGAPMSAGLAHGISRAGRLSTKNQEAAVQERIEPTLEDGADNAPLSPTTPPAPKFDQPTAPLDADQKSEIDALIASIDADLITPEQITQAKQIVTAHEEAQKAPANQQAEISWAPLQAAPAVQQDIGELGASKKQTDNAQAYINPNSGDRMDRKFLYGPEGSEGLTPRQIVAQPGTYTLGEASADRPAEYLKALHDTMEQWRTQFMPNSTLILSNEDLFTKSALGAHISLTPGMHMIVPAVLRSPSRGLGAFNVNTQASAFYNASHEFGHALVLDRFFEALPSEVGQSIQQASQTGLIPAELIAKMPAGQQAVLSEFNRLKEKILNNQMSAEDFVKAWFQPGKLGMSTFLKDLDVAPTDNAMAVIKAIINRAVKNSNVRDQVKQTEFRAKIQADYLSLEEYLANQVARHAYSAKWDKTTPLGQFFQGALDSLRKFFASIKANGYIKPGTAFSSWINGLSKVSRPIDEKAQIVEGKTQGAPGKKAAAPKPAAPKKAKPKKKVAVVQHNAETDTLEAQQAQMSALLDQLFQAKEIGLQTKNELQKLVDEGDFDAFIDKFAPIAAKNVKFELDDILDFEESYPGEFKENVTPQEITAYEKSLTEYKEYFGDEINVLRAGLPEEHINAEVLAQAQQEWKEKQFRSRFFKAWFGDWENDSENASKIRRGLVAAREATSQEMANATDTGDEFGMPLPPGMKGEVQEVQAFPTGEPLIVYHATTVHKTYNYTGAPSDNVFEKFARGDIGFHFGTVRAAHERIHAVLPEAGTENQYLAEGKFVIPAVLNIRNPLFLPDDLGNWGEAVPMASILNQTGHFTREELDLAIASVRHIQKSSLDFSVAYAERAYQEMLPFRELMVSKGFDGIAYSNAVEDAGSISFIAFHPNQVKSILGSRTFSRSDNMHFELDFDAAEPGAIGARKLMNGVKDFVSDQGPIRRSLRYALKGIAFKVLELQQLAHLNPDIDELAFMSQKNTEYNRYKSQLQSKADAVVSKWERLGKENFAKLNRFLQAESEGGELWFDLRKGQDGSYEYAFSPTTGEKLQSLGIDPTTQSGEIIANLALEIKNVLLYQLNEAERALFQIVAHRYAAGGQSVITAAAIPIKRHIQELRKYPFFPQGRFGNFVLTIQQERAQGAGNDIIYRESFESRSKWEEAWTAANSNKQPGQEVRKHEVKDSDYVLMSLPTDFVDLAASELGLTDAQVENLMNILQPVKREKVLSPYEQSKLGIKGYTSDALRSFSNFTWHNANLLAKLVYRADFNLAIRGVGLKLREAQFSRDPKSMEQVFRLGRMQRFMERVRDYVMAPPNEAQNLRAAVSVGYLMLNVKTALLNLYGMSTTWSDITSRFGQLEGNKLFAKNSLWALRSIKLTNLNERNSGKYMPEAHQKALDQAISEGVLSQSYAYHLAGMANQGNLRRLFPQTRSVSQGFKAVVDAGMYPFRLTELSTRRTTFLIEFEAASRRPNTSFQEAYTLAVQNTNKLQNDYSLGNRVPFMRGLRSDNKVVSAVVPMATVFASFMQHMSFHAYGGYELGERRAAQEAGETPRSVWGGYTMKIWILTLLLAGYEGLPGAENILDLLEVAWRKFGGKKPYRHELREMVQAIDGDPQLFARGFGHNIAGYDVSRSLGLGRIVPGTDSLDHAQQDVMKTVGSLVLDVAGPTGGFIKFGLQAGFGNKPPSESFEHLPGGMGNIYTAYRWSQNGVRAPSGAKVTHDLDTGKLRDLTADEILMKGLGFNPTIVSQNREVLFSQFDRKIYWQSRRQDLLMDSWRARVNKDREAQADTKKAIIEYNAGIPTEYKDLRISGQDMLRSVQTHEKAKAFEEAQLSGQRRYRHLYEDVKKSYEPGSKRGPGL